MHLRFGNLRRKDYHALLAKMWPNIEALRPSHKLICAYQDHIEAASDLQSLHESISKDSPQNAANVVGRILDAIATLETFPHRKVVEWKSGRLRVSLQPS